MEQINKILVATDFSSNGAKAVNYGATLANQLNADLILLHVEDERQKKYVSHQDKYKSYSAYVQDQFELINQNYLVFKHMNHSFITRKGLVSNTIVDVANELGIDIILLGISGLNKGFELEFGSVTLKVLNKISCPIIVVPEEYESFKLDNILVATDHLMPETEHHIDLIDFFIEKYDSDVQLMHVGEDGAIQTENYRKLLTKTSPFGESTGSVAKNAEIIEKLMVESEQFHSDLIVIFRRKKSLTSGNFMPRLSNLIAINMTVPILFIPCESDDQNHESD